MVAVAILAAGRGTRMKSSLPKVLHPLGAKSLVERVLDSVADIKPRRVFVIVGYEADHVRESLTAYATRENLGYTIEFIEQTEQLGTGHAVQQLLPHLQGFEDELLVLNGDVPLLRPSTIGQLLDSHRSRGNSATILTAQLPDPTGYGRVFCGENDEFESIIEDRDCTPEQRYNARINAGIYCFNWLKLEQVLPTLTTNNDQAEYYITDAVNYLSPVTAMDVADYQEIFGINDRVQLAKAYGILQTRKREALMRAGVLLIDPASVTIDDGVTVGAETVIEPQTHLRGNTTIGCNCRLGPGSLIENSTIGDGVTAMYSVISDSTIASNTEIGPFAHLRRHAEIGSGCRIGNFVEVKQSTIGDQSKAAHLSYLGNAHLGKRVNIAAGTITANYDGVNKHPTTIGSGSKTGANSVLVAPITIGENVTIAAGSTITKDVEDDSLAIGRARQVSRKGWTLKPSPSQPTPDGSDRSL